jgi:hypothetical protein
MQKLIYVIVLALSFSAFASELEDVKTCLNNWGDHPFKEGKLKYRIISSKVKVMGIGGEMAEEKATKNPELVLVKPNVNVMTKNIIKLSNPNGWYCLQNKVDVMAKTEIQLGCKSHLTASNSGATVIGSDTNETGVTVLGKTTVSRLDCGGDKADSKEETKETTKKE